MNKNHLAVWTCATAFGLALPSAVHAGRGDPAQAGQPTPPLRYDSAFTDYKPWRDPKPADRRAVHDALKDAPEGSGHAGHGVDVPRAAGSAPAARPATAATPAAPVTVPPASGHGGRRDHGGTR